MDIINKKIVTCTESCHPYLTKNHCYVVHDESPSCYLIKHDDKNMRWFGKGLFKKHSFKPYNLWI